MHLLGGRIKWRTCSKMQWLPVFLVSLWMLQTVDTLTGPHVCSEKQKYNVTKRIKYRAPMAVRTYEWCLAVPPRCSRWTTEMKDLTKLETEERTMEVAVCCPGFVMKAASCHAKCSSGKTGHDCTEKCSKSRWGPSCSMECVECPEHSFCSPYTGNCVCADGWKGERCEKSMDEETTVIIVPSTPITSTVTSTTTALLTSHSTLEMTVPSTEATKSTMSSIGISPTSLTTENSKFMPTTQKSTTSVTTTKVETTRQLPPVSQDTDNITDNIINYPNVTKEYKHELEIRVTELATPKMTQWTITEPPIIITTTATKLTTENRPPSTIKTTLKDVLTTHPQAISTSKTPLMTTETTTKILKPFPTASNAKPKEIWIKPTQKGDSLLIEPKHENSAVTDFHRHKYSTKSHPFTDKTTPKTIIVSIIPTSIDHTAVFKKITIATSEHKPIKKVYISNNTTRPSMWKIITATGPNFKIMTTTAQPVLKRNMISSAKILNRVTSLPNTVNPLLIRNISKYLKEMSSETSKTNNSNSYFSISPMSITPYVYTKLPNVTNVNSSNFSFAKNISNNNISSKAHPKLLSSTTTILSSVTPSKPLSQTYSTSRKVSPVKFVTKIIKLNTTSIITRKYLLTTPPTASSYANISKVLKFNSTLPLPTVNFLPTSSTTRRPRTLITTRQNLIGSTTFATDASIINNWLNTEHNVTATSKSTTIEDTTFKPIIPKLIVKADKDAIGRIKDKDESKNKLIKEYKDTEAPPKLTNTNHNLATNQALTNTITPTETDRDEVFNVLTEPEHITAVVDGAERNTDNLLSVLSIVVGVMFAVITVAVIIVMMERCRRARYEDVVKFNNLRMRAMEGDEHPPRYVRSIFHTPLPDPPASEKSHYQPISTLDRNLKQFMRPVAVHSISPVMMENFRGILECHYDHLPIRNSHISFRSDTLSSQFRSSATPSTESPSQRSSQRSPVSIKKLPVTDVSVEKLKHDGKVEVLDSSNVEPLYAEIPCWRLVPQHAIEIVNLNGEAVTEL